MLAFDLGAKGIDIHVSMALNSSVSLHFLLSYLLVIVQSLCKYSTMHVLEGGFKYLATAW
jgi:hypothetical protein